jgi:hypothetical protein
VKEGTEGAYVIGVKRVNELDFYSLGLHELAEKAGLTRPKTLAVVRALHLQDDPEYFKVIQIKASRFNRYSPKALDAIQKALPTISLDEVWRKYGMPRGRKKK